jgi:hypothetical protein
MDVILFRGRDKPEVGTPDVYDRCKLVEQQPLLLLLMTGGVSVRILRLFYNL